jgi:hypothetical protein
MCIAPSISLVSLEVPLKHLQEVSDRNATQLKTLLSTITQFAPALHTPILQEVTAVATSLGVEVAVGLDQLAVVEMSSSAVLTTEVAGMGRRMTRAATLCWELVTTLEWTPAIAWKEGTWLQLRHRRL